MKATITNALLAICAVVLIAIAYKMFTGGGSASTNATMANAPEANKSAMAQPNATAPARNTFDPLTPPSAQPVESGPKTSMAFPLMDHDFGKVPQGSENKYTFKFTNTGKIPLMISNAVGSCGCTVPDYPKEPVAPGAQGVINVVYKPGQQQGVQQKTVTVTANTEPSQTLLHINADVQVVAGATPVAGGH